MKELPTVYQQFIHTSRYARWLDDSGRRETWEETVDRYLTFFSGHLQDNPAVSQYQDAIPSLRKSILGLDVMPSMRALMTAGKALERDAMSGYNCSFVAVDHQRVFDEVMYVLMCGTGVGYSVERQFISKLPEIAEEFHPSKTCIKVHDSKIGWAAAFKEMISLLYSGNIPSWDVSLVRPSGARLKTFGGRASGPEPLERLFKFSINMFKNAAGRRLTSLECHDLLCVIADVVVVGGVRRSAMLSLSNLSDDRMRIAKSGRWYEIAPYRQLANNSAVYNERPDMQIFLDEWKSLYESHSGERGIFNRAGIQNMIKAGGKRDPNHEFGCNPCSEIILRSMETCNLSEVIIRPEDTIKTLKKKVELATILGTLQATITDFRYLRKKWKDNAEEERLLGVSLTGLMDHPVLCSVNDEAKKWLEVLKETAVSVNKTWAQLLGIPQSAAVTCVKPSGTVSQLVDCSSGLHARYSKYYIRTVRADRKDPLTQFMIEKGIPCEEAIGKPETMVFSFPTKSPDSAVCEGSRSAIEQLEYWKMLQDHWCEHKPSCTVYYKPEEFLGVGDWVYKNFNSISGISFLPYEDHVYQQAPYQPITEEKYEELLKAIPTEIDWTTLTDYETEDNTAGSQTFACAGGVCEVVDITK
jgi:ribonucleoside-triphosphate reductase